MTEKEKKFSIYNGKRVVQINISLIRSYEDHVSAFNADVAETILRTGGLDESYPNGVLTEGLKILMSEEIETGKSIHELVLNGNILNAIRNG